jgi:hypothetical protein
MEIQELLYKVTPYLPYGLKCLHNGQPKEIMGIRNYLGWCYVVNDDTGETNTPISACKAVLKPQSDLLPWDDGELNDYVLIRLVENTDGHCDAYDEWRDSYFDNPTHERLLQAPYEVFIEMIKQHYDVYNLIPRGLAIDINNYDNGNS